MMANRKDVKIYKWVRKSLYHVSTKHVWVKLIHHTKGLQTMVSDAKHAQGSPESKNKKTPLQPAIVQV